MFSKTGSLNAALCIKASAYLDFYVEAKVRSYGLIVIRWFAGEVYGLTLRNDILSERIFWDF